MGVSGRHLAQPLRRCDAWPSCRRSRPARAVRGRRRSRAGRVARCRPGSRRPPRSSRRSCGPTSSSSSVSPERSATSASPWLRSTYLSLITNCTLQRGMPRVEAIEQPGLHDPIDDGLGAGHADDAGGFGAERVDLPLERRHRPLHALRRTAASPGRIRSGGSRWAGAARATGRGAAPARRGAAARWIGRPRAHGRRPACCRVAQPPADA